MICLDEKANQFFNAVLADVEWQTGLTPSQRDLGLNFAHEWILDAIINTHDTERAYANVREALRRLAALTRGDNSFVLRRGEHVEVMEK